MVTIQGRLRSVEQGKVTETKSRLTNYDNISCFPYTYHVI